MKNFPYKLLKTPIWVWHVSIWSIYVLYVYIINAIEQPDVVGLPQVLLHLFPFALYFYACLYAFRLIRKKGPVIGSAMLVLSLVSLFCFAYLYTYYFLPLIGFRVYATATFNAFVGRMLMGVTQYAIYAAAYFLFETLTLASHNLSQERAEKEKVQMEYTFLLSQINSHFLYNTLNVLYSEAQLYSEELANKIMKLSLVMRYAVESVNRREDKVFIGEEWKQIQILIDIHQFRFAKALCIDCHVEGTMDKQVLPPLSLVTIVENALKYGEAREREYPIQIRLWLAADTIRFYCHNKKKKRTLHEMYTSNIGLGNVKKRLDLSFKDRYEMAVTDLPDTYTLHLTIKQ